MTITPLLDQTDFSTCLNANLRAVTRAVDAVYRKHLKPYGLTESQFNIMAVVAQMHDVAQSEVGRILIMERSTVSRDLRRLVERGIIHREGPTNRLQLVLTDRGGRLMESLVPVWKAAMKEASELLGGKANQVMQLRQQL